MRCFVDVFLDKTDVERMLVNHVHMCLTIILKPRWLLYGSFFNLLWALFTILNSKIGCRHSKMCINLEKSSNIEWQEHDWKINIFFTIKVGTMDQIEQEGILQDKYKV